MFVISHPNSVITTVLTTVKTSPQIGPPNIPGGVGNTETFSTHYHNNQTTMWRVEVEFVTTYQLIHHCLLTIQQVTGSIS